MILHHLPDRTGGAAENMAIDFLLLQRYPEPDVARFRHYDWRRPAVTFGYSQKWEYVLSQRPPDHEFCRRPTGGGIVDHIADWTYALVIPRDHSLYREPAPLSYFLVHQALRDALLEQDQDVVLQTEETDAPQTSAGPGLCFVRAEPHDVIERTSRAKIAGAALKRNKNGLLFQGSIASSPLPAICWDTFATAFTRNLTACLSAEYCKSPWPSFDPDEEAHLTDQFSTPEWNQRR